LIKQERLGGNLDMILKRKFKIATLIVLVGILITSFKQEKNELIGNWKLKGDFYSLTYLEFQEDYFEAKGIDQFPILKTYKIRGDTLIIEAEGEIRKIRFEVNEQELKLFDIKTDTLLQYYERYNYPNHLNYLNVKLNTNISVPLVNSDNVLEYLKENVIMAEYDEMKNLKILVNGRKHILNDTSYILLQPESEMEIIQNFNFLFIDKKLRLYDYNRLLNELQKANIHKFTNIAIKKDGKLCCVNQKLYNGTSYENRYQIPPSPPAANSLKPIKPKFSKNNCILFGKYLDKVEINGKVSSFDEFKTQLRNEINSGNLKFLFLYFDEKIDYGTYLNDIVEIRNIYQSIQNEYSAKKFNVNNAKELQYEESKLIAEKFPMNFYFIFDGEEYEKTIMSAR